MKMSSGDGKERKKNKDVRWRSEFQGRRFLFQEELHEHWRSSSDGADMWDPLGLWGENAVP